jgi:phage-related protein
MMTPLGRWRIAFYEDARGRNPVREYLDGLPAQEQAEAEEAFSLLREFGILLGMPHARPVTGHSPLWELRPGANRIFYCAHTGRQFIMLHAFRKQSQKTPEREIRLAEKRLAQFLEEARESTC